MQRLWITWRRTVQERKEKAQRRGPWRKVERPGAAKFSVKVGQAGAEEQESGRKGC